MTAEEKRAYQRKKKQESRARLGPEVKPQVKRVYIPGAGMTG